VGRGDLLDRSESKICHFNSISDGCKPTVFFWYPVIIDSSVFILTMWRGWTIFRNGFQAPWVTLVTSPGHSLTQWKFRTIETFVKDGAIYFLCISTMNGFAAIMLIVRKHFIIPKSNLKSF